MPRFGLVKRADLIRYLKKAGFDGPFAGAKHQLMIRGDRTLRIPNPHQSDIGKNCWQGFCARQELIKTNGNDFELNQRIETLRSFVR